MRPLLLEGELLEDRDYISFISIIFAWRLAPIELFIKSEDEVKEIEEKVE